MSLQDQMNKGLVKTSGGLTRAQTYFLQAYLRRPLGPNAELWPAPGVMRKWLRSAPFRRAMTSVREVQRMQAEMHLTAASVAAARAMQDLVGGAVSDPTVLEAQSKHVTALTNILRLTHVWQRFATQHAMRKEQMEAKRDEQARPRVVDPYRDADPEVLSILDGRPVRS